MNKIILLILIFCVPYQVCSQNITEEKQTTISKWDFDAAPYIWFSSIKGDISFLNQSIAVNAEFKDILDQLSFGALIHIEAHKGPWTLMTDLIYMKIKEDGTLKNSSQKTELEINQTVFELGVGYRIVKLQGYLTIDGLFGLRYFGLNPTLDINQQNVLDKSMDFVDPFFGIRFKNINDKWINSARFDVGGLGIGSEISWKLNLLIGYQFSELFALYVGYQGYDVDYKNGDSFRYNIYTGGLITGFNFHF